MNTKELITPLQCLVDKRDCLNRKLQYMNEHTWNYTEHETQSVIKLLNSYETAIQKVK